MANDRRVSIIEILSEVYNVNTIHAFHATFAILSTVSMVCALLLYFYNDRPVHFTDLFDLQILTDPNFFYTNTLDCVWLVILEFILLPIIAWRAVLAGKVSEIGQSSSRGSRSYCDCFRCCYFGKTKTYSALSKSAKDIGEPLLTSSSYVDDETSLNSTPKKPEVVKGFETADAAIQLDKNETDKNYLEDRQSRERHMSMWMFGLFVVSTTAQVYLGLKCISFEFKREDREGPLMGLGVLWVNLMVWTLREMVTRHTKEEGELLPALHPHRLYLHLTVAGHHCDVCHKRVTGGRAYRCKLCDFDLCIRCHSRRSNVALEGQLRGDKGVRQEETITGDKYFKRAIALAGTEWMLFAVAMGCLCCTNGLALLLPRIQGDILDSVVHETTSHFNEAVRFYLLVSVLSGFFGGAQSLCFNIVGRKLSNTVRRRLFKGIVVQDVAFFDGNTSGQLTSRISNDVGFMVSPIQTMLGTLVSNSILLLGGIIMCFFTSWRLSMLAFVTVGPIVIFRLSMGQIYATWSQRLNREIFAALATANSHATEALGNIRTVKAFAAEKMETDKFDEAILTALARGITDAFGGAGMYTINSYLDLGAGVLILWYGGVLAIEGKDGLTAGKLITYQLYWNMLNNAYKGLLDILTSFTRAGAAAQRVFALMDSLPDIDLDEGEPVNEVQGSLELENVLQNVSLSIPAGSTCALVGRSGGGKSTIVNLLLRFYDPHEGLVRLDGRDMRELRLRDVRKYFGVVQQNTELFGGSIEDNI
eukprot:gene9444-19619_t